MQPATGSFNQLGRPLGTGRDWCHRLLRHHLPLAVGSGVLLVVFMGLPPFTSKGFPQLDNMAPSLFPTAATSAMHGGMPDAPQGGDGGRGFASSLTVASGNVATVLLALTLLIGPANLLLRRRNPISTSLPRDIGTWAAIASIVHVIVGLRVHGNPSDTFSFVVYFFTGDGAPRTNGFGLGNWTGLAALVIVTGLLALSNDRSLRELKAARWKSLQRLNYSLFALVVLHAFFYGALLRATSPFTVLLIVTVVAVLAGQAVGIRLWRRRHAHAGHTAEHQLDEPPPRSTR
jgi:sulfoxide reductase heme-binding subunit YedZ